VAAPDCVAHACAQTFDESASHYFAQNNVTFGPGPTFGFPPALLALTVFKAAINGLSWCTLKGLTAEAGSRVRWHVGGQVLPRPEPRLSPSFQRCCFQEFTNS